DEALGTEVLHTLLHQHLTGATQAEAVTVQVAAEQAVADLDGMKVDLNAGLYGFLAEVRAFGHFDFPFLFDKGDLGHKDKALMVDQERGPAPSLLRRLGELYKSFRARAITRLPQTRPRPRMTWVARGRGNRRKRCRITDHADGPP